MADLFFPQMSSGALAQYPIKKALLARTIKNVLPDGSMITLADSLGARLVWQMTYIELSTLDIEALQSHFSACMGPYRAFTFIDPTDNMFNFSSDLTATAWDRSSLISVLPGQSDPEGGTAAFTVVNQGQASQIIGQTLNVPANYQYCFSVYAQADQAGELTLVRNGISPGESTIATIGPAWTRIISSGRLNDAGTSFTAGISVAPGQQVRLYGPQLEAQIAPSRYRVTADTGGVYPNSHWGVEELEVSADAPNLFSTTFSIETAR
ncbi:MAG: hypothetical protein JOZ36_17345 [Acidobacteria bacterium]|nr:hypothetical protein [Acidobacteriota bacterium]